MAYETQLDWTNKMFHGCGCDVVEEDSRGPLAGRQTRGAARRQRGPDLPRRQVEQRRADGQLSHAPAAQVYAQHGGLAPVASGRLLSAVGTDPTATLLRAGCMALHQGVADVVQPRRGRA